MAWAGTQRRYGSKPATKAQRKARAINFVCYCSPERLASLTAEEVARFSGVAVAEAQAMLERARGVA